MSRLQALGGRGRRRAHGFLFAAGIGAAALIVAAWIAAAGIATLTLPGPGQSDSGLDLPVPRDAAALSAEHASYRAFGFPLISRTMVVQRDAGGLSDQVLASSVGQAARASLHEDAGLRGLSAAVPVTDAIVPTGGGVRQPTTIVTYLLFGQGVSTGRQAALAHRYAARLGPGASVVGVTGTVPARVEMTHAINGALLWVTIGTALLVGAVVGLAFRAVGSALVALAAIAVSYLVAVRVTGWVALATGLGVPSEVDPVIIVLLFGIVTDYSIFFLVSARARLREGDDRVTAVRGAVGEVGTVVAAAGLTVAVGTAALTAAHLSFFRSFGPALALSALVGTLACLTFVPALLALGGTVLFWPSATRRRDAPAGSTGAGAVSCARSAVGAVAGALTRRRWAAAVVVVAVIGCLGAAASYGTRIRLDPTVIGALPGGSEPARAARAAGAGFAPGIMSPMVVLVRGGGVDQTRAAALQHEIEGRPGVASALGPGTGSRLGLGVATRRAFLRADHGIARILVVLDSDPLQPAAIADFRGLRDAMPSLLRDAGIPGARVSIAGDTAVASESMAATSADLWRVGVVACVAMLILLAALLRSPVMAPLLLGVELLILGAALGITAFLVQHVQGRPGLQHFVPFASAILLLALGSDYGIYVVRRVWGAGGDVREGLVRVLPAAAAVIALAGLVLAGSFGLLALVPTAPFREFAVAMAIGVCLVVFVGTMVLVPALIALLGPAARWPSGRRARRSVSAGGARDDQGARAPAGS